ncbi:hypothetical protein POM88_007527 [Heracleum sosnowskyi]|uniref:HECT domain-containing protein n=1 Tax=Heracleum sosnowskyi TaxID=360622 RepID=A0AAD8J6C0_9APIA|nr:hypothetical protein POM88_007527 [Heracleum sosnowskyi]
MTCANYLKLPPYSTKDVMYKKLIYAISEGHGSLICRSVLNLLDCMHRLRSQSSSFRNWTLLTSKVISSMLLNRGFILVPINGHVFTSCYSNKAIFSISCRLSVEVLFILT